MMMKIYRRGYCEDSAEDSSLARANSKNEEPNTLSARALSRKTPAMSNPTSYLRYNSDENKIRNGRRSRNPFWTLNHFSLAPANETFHLFHIHIVFGSFRFRVSTVEDVWSCCKKYHPKGAVGWWPSEPEAVDAGDPDVPKHFLQTQSGRQWERHHRVFAASLNELPRIHHRSVRVEWLQQVEQQNRIGECGRKPRATMKTNEKNSRRNFYDQNPLIYSR